MMRLSTSQTTCITTEYLEKKNRMQLANTDVTLCCNAAALLPFLAIKVNLTIKSRLLRQRYGCLVNEPNAVGESFLTYNPPNLFPPFCIRSCNPFIFDRPHCCYHALDAKNFLHLCDASTIPNRTSAT